MTNSVSDERKIEISEIARIMSTTGGRKFITRVLDQCGVYSDVFNSDTHEHARNAGRRQIGLWLVRELEEAARGEYLTLLRERNND